MTKLTQAQIDHEFALLLSGDATDRTELAVRHLMVAICGIALWYATDQIVMLIWGFGYFVVNSLYVRFLRHQVMPIQRKTFVACIAGGVAVASYFAAMVVYVGFQNDGELLILAAFGSIGLGLHCLSRNSDFSYSCYVDAVAAVLSSIGVAVAAASFATTLWGSVAIYVGAVCTIGYFVLSFQQIISERKKLAETLEAESQSQKMQALGQLTSGIAHDFNNLLTVVRGNIELALLDNDASKTTGYLDSADEAAGRGAELVQQLLAYARQSRLRQSDIELGQMLSRVPSILRRVLPAHIDLMIEIPDDDLFIYADPVLLDSALLNLIINARDAIGTENGCITLSAKARANKVLLTVTDTGTGIDETVLSRVTEPFFTTKKAGQGSGLGLSMVKGFVRQSGGELSLRNNPEGGFSAIIELPAGRGEAEKIPSI